MYEVTGYAGTNYQRVVFTLCVSSGVINVVLQTPAIAGDTSEASLCTFASFYESILPPRYRHNPERKQSLAGVTCPAINGVLNIPGSDVVRCHRDPIPRSQEFLWLPFFKQLFQPNILTKAHKHRLRNDASCRHVNSTHTEGN